MELGPGNTLHAYHAMYRQNRRAIIKIPQALHADSHSPRVVSVLRLLFACTSVPIKLIAHHPSLITHHFFNYTRKKHDIAAVLFVLKRITEFRLRRVHPVWHRRDRAVLSEFLLYAGRASEPEHRRSPEFRTS